MLSCSSIYIQAQSLAFIILGFFFIMVPLLGLQMKLILVMRAGHLLVAMQMTTSVPLRTGSSKSSARASTTIFLVTGMVYLSEERTKPGLMASKAVSSISLICRSILSPTTASFTFSLLMRIYFTRHWVSKGRMISFSSFFITPPSILPERQCPFSLPYCDSQMLVIVILKGLSMGRGGMSKLAIVSMKDWLYTTPSAWNFLTFLGVMLIALMALMGTNRMASSVKPICKRQCCSFRFIAVNLSTFHSILSILFMATMSLCTPSDLTMQACSLVCPPPTKEVSKLSVSMTRMAQSAWAAPVIILGMNSLCPGESRNTIFLPSSSIFLTPTSMVTPRFLSSSVESVTHACLNDSFPISLDSFSFLCTSFLSRQEASLRKMPTSVDLPESTWPTTTILTVLLGLKSLLIPKEGYSELQWSVKQSSTTYELLRTLTMGSSCELFLCTSSVFLTSTSSLSFYLASCSCFSFSLRLASLSSFSLAFLSSFSLSFCRFFLILSTTLSKLNFSLSSSFIASLSCMGNMLSKLSTIYHSSKSTHHLPSLRSLYSLSEQSSSSYLP